jgi:hypothetical protein
MDRTCPIASDALVCSLMFEAHEQAPEVVAVLVDPVVQFLYVRLLQIPDHLLLQLA